ncbi:ABC transporter ATP-binding protein [Mycolicibacterium confluentis]|uniref:ABC transporter ATP-binding protein n=1 Tax=Mycolicibacterium confluentis TaxID=28047 RepID=UPI000A149CB5|nr:ABC transporter ATP-binding protein [Mycolicibacterium confluentis]MCV7321669.1 ABC transporter ATP-binding protein [Mycolicibacterium confluentis]ORV32281.1 sugar ABC transporter [Mycolicibacterium confluentis]
MAEASAEVTLSGISRAFGALRVLDGVDLQVPAGTMTAVLGPSGCGKTTLLRIVAGFESPDAGSVRIAGDVVAGSGAAVPAHRRRVGLMPQEGALFPHRTVAGNIAFGLRAAHRRDSAAVVARWLEVVGLSGLADARPGQLSGGQQQRVALARALAAGPRVLLLDEPFAALDAGLRVRVREDITAILRESGTTAILVTHDQDEALSLADTVAVLFDGTIAQHAAPADLYDRPATLQVARFVGGTVELAGDCRGGVVRTALGAHPVRIPVPDGPVTMVARPEQLHLGGGDDPRGTVTDRRYYGSRAVLRVRLDGGAQVSVHTQADVAAASGDQVTVGVRGTVLAFASPSGGQGMALGEPGG